MFEIYKRKMIILNNKRISLHIIIQNSQLRINRQCNRNKTFIIHIGYLKYLSCLLKWVREGKIKWLLVSLMPQEVWDHFGRIWLNFGTNPSLSKPTCLSHSAKMPNWKNIPTLSRTLRSMVVVWPISLMLSNSYSKDWLYSLNKLQSLWFSFQTVRILWMGKTN